MCEIQFIMTSEPRSELAKTFKQLLKCGYNNGNNDATGYILYNEKNGYVTNKAAKHIKKLATHDVMRAMSTCRLMIGHNRFTTQGDEKNNYNNHPFELGEFYLVHNGVVTFSKSGDEIYNQNVYKNDYFIETDSYQFFVIWQYFFKMSDKETRQEKIFDAIQKTINETWGYYSIFITDTLDDEVYYFRNSTAKFTFYGKENNDKWDLMGSTEAVNLYDFFRGTKHKLGEFDAIERTKVYTLTPEPGAVYKINPLATQITETIVNIGKLSILEGRSNPNWFPESGYDENYTRWGSSMYGENEFEVDEEEAVVQRITDSYLDIEEWLNDLEGVVQVRHRGNGVLAVDIDNNCDEFLTIKKLIRRCVNGFGYEVTRAEYDFFELRKLHTVSERVPPKVEDTMTFLGYECRTTRDGVRVWSPKK